MRNTLVQTLPPKSELTLTIDPPMSVEEKHYLLAPAKTVVARVVDTAHVSITNPTDQPVYFVFTVAPIMRFPTGVGEAISAFLAARKSP